MIAYAREPLLEAEGPEGDAGARASPKVLRASGRHEGSAGTSVALLTAGAVGTGVLALPYGVSRVGVLPAVALFAVAGTAAGASNTILFRCAQETGHSSYGQLMTDILGKWGATVLDAFVCLEGIGTVATYLVFIMDFVPQICQLADYDVWCTDRASVAVAVMLIVWPLSCMRGLSALRYLSVCSIATVLFTSAVVVSKAPGHFARTGRPLRPVLMDIRVDTDVLHVLSMACFAYFVHTITPEIALQFHAPTRRRIIRVVGVHTLLLWAVYCTIGVCGFLSFVGYIHQDFLMNYNLDDHLVVVCKMLLSATLVFACPLCLLPSRRALFDILERIRMRSTAEPTAVAMKPLHDSAAMRVLVATSCLAIALLVAARSPHVADLMSVICAFFTAPLMFAFPAVMSWRILKDRNVLLPAGLLLLTLALWVAEVVRLLRH